VTPEAEAFLRKARRCLANSNTILAIPATDVAEREAYLAGYHAAEAFIFEHTGNTVKTHKGLCSEFARPTRTDTALCEFGGCLARAYELKSIADHGVDRGIDISVDDAKEAYDLACRFVANLAESLAP
jgi:uncharacterized protein (UPF0332 family)